MQEQLQNIADSIDNFEAMGTDDVYGMTPNGNLGQIAYNLNAIKEELENISGILMANMKSK
mgnify:FL=1